MARDQFLAQWLPAPQRDRPACLSAVFSSIGRLVTSLECNVLEPLPYIFYQLTQGTVGAMLPRISDLPKHDWLICLLGREKLLDGQTEVYSFLRDPKPSQKCQTFDQCTQFGRMLQRKHLANNIDRNQIALLSFFNSDGQASVAISKFCAGCLAAYGPQTQVAREKIWKKLPDYFGLGSWKELRIYESE